MYRSKTSMEEEIRPFSSPQPRKTSMEEERRPPPPPSSSSSSSSSSPPQPHILFFPFVSSGHMIPMIQMANLFSSRGIKSTMISTPINHSFLQRYLSQSPEIQLLSLPFPDTDHNLEEGSIATTLPMTFSYLPKLTIFSGALRQQLESNRPQALISDMFLPWTNAIAHEFQIPRVTFHGFGAFPLCVRDIIDNQCPHEDVASENGKFLLPGLPGKIEFTKSELPIMYRQPPTPLKEVLDEMWKEDDQSYGVVVNSFHELEAEYVDFYKNAIGRKAWLVGPMFLTFPRTQMDLKSESSSTKIISNWLDSNGPNSVVYICFGSLSNFSNSQLHQIAVGLTTSPHPFIWVVGDKNETLDDDVTISNLFNNTMLLTTDHMGSSHDEEMKLWGVFDGGSDSQGRLKGIVVEEGWAPQLEILNHRSVGGFVTHCGWNSVLEGVCCEVAMVTWPLGAEQFYNEKLVVDVLGIGVGVGSKVWTTDVEERPIVGGEVIAEAIGRVMGGDDEAVGVRRRAKELGEKGRRAVEGGGSSQKDLDRLIEELVGLKG